LKKKSKTCFIVKSIAAGALGLYRRAFISTIAAKNTAVSLFGFQ